MKKIAPILIVLLFTKCSNLKYLNAYDGWKGKPKMVEISYYNVEKEFWYGKQLIYYDSKGRILKQPNINRAGNIVDGEKKFIYDKKGNIIEYIHYGKDSVIHINRTNTYNKNGKILELKYIIKEGNKSINYTYNTIEKSSRASDFVYNKDGTVKEKNISRITTFYDKKWNEIGHTYYDSDGSIRRKGELKYDKKGNPILNVSFDYKTKKRRITEKKYNKYNDIVSWTIKVITEKDTTITNISEFKYLYDHKNNPVEVKSFSNGKILYKIRNKFLY
jgi:hypothetical protein